MHVDVSKVSTALSLTVSDDIITYGSATTLRATMQGGAPSSVVRFDRRNAKGWKPVGTARVGSEHIATLDVRPSARSTYRAVFVPTTNRAGSQSSTASVQVHAELQSDLIGKGTADGRYTVYACCTAYFYVKLKPPHPGSRWIATVQYQTKQGWRQLGQATYRFEQDGDAAIYLNAVTGFRYRVRGHWNGDANHLGSTSAWRYFRYR